MPPIDPNAQAHPGITGSHGYGNMTPAVAPNGEYIWVEHAAGLTIRAEIAARCMAGILAAESDDNGYSPTYISPEGQETFAKTSYPDSGRGGPDYTKDKRVHTLLRTAAQNQARAAVEAADALIAELNRTA